MSDFSLKLPEDFIYLLSDLSLSLPVYVFTGAKCSDRIEEKRRVIYLVSGEDRYISYIQSRRGRIYLVSRAGKENISYIQSRRGRIYLVSGVVRYILYPEQERTDIYLVSRAGETGYIFTQSRRGRI